MASKEIELMPAEIRAEKRKKETKRIAILVSIAFLIISASLTAAVLAFYTVLLAELNSTKKAIETEKRKVETFKDTEIMAQRVQSKAEAIGSLLKAKNYYSTLFRTLSEVSPQDVTISNLSVTGGGVNVSGTAKSYIAVAKFLLVVVDPEKGGKLFDKAELTSVSLDDKSGEARFAVTLSLIKGSLQRK